MSTQCVEYIACIGDTVIHRHTNEAGVVAMLATNVAGHWLYVETQRGQPIGWWHHTDIAVHPISMPPDSKRAVGQDEAEVA